MSSDETKSANEETKTNWLANLDDACKAEPNAATLKPSAQAGTRELPPLGLLLGDYAIEAELGRGGMGVVYLAFDPRLNCHVALKLMLHTATPSNLWRFREEAQVTAQLQHPSTVPIYDVGQTESGELYYTMRLVRGPTLAQLVDEHRSRMDLGDVEVPEGWTLFKLLQVFVTVCRSVSNRTTAASSIATSSPATS